MDEALKRPLRVFLCHASQDKSVVRKLSYRLEDEGWIDAWLDEKKLLLGQDWRLAIEEAVEASDIVIICLSSNSMSKEGFVQKELRYAREIALEKPDQTIFLIPLRLDECLVPRGLRFYQWGDYFGEKLDETYSVLLESLKLRYRQMLRLEEDAHQEAEKQKSEIDERFERGSVEREAAEKVTQHETESKRVEKVLQRAIEVTTFSPDTLKPTSTGALQKLYASQGAAIINSFVRQALISAQEVMGDNGLNAVLHTSGLEGFIGNFPPNNLEPSIQASQYARLNQAIEEFYGRAGKGMLRRIGRASFQYAVREESALLSVAGVALKLLPEKQRIKFILNEIVDGLKKSNPQMIAWVDEIGDRLAYVESTCAICHNRQSETPICYLYIGSISEAVQWATRNEHEVIETHCLAKGDPYCRFEIG